MKKLRRGKRVELCGKWCLFTFQTQLCCAEWYQGTSGWSDKKGPLLKLSSKGMHRWLWGDSETKMDAMRGSNGIVYV
jgi:hypothetical protein